MSDKFQNLPTNLSLLTILQKYYCHNNALNIKRGLSADLPASGVENLKECADKPFSCTSSSRTSMDDDDEKLMLSDSPVLHSNQVCPTGWKQRRRSFPEKKRQGFPKNCSFLLWTRSFLQRASSSCAASVHFVAIISTYLHCPHARLLMFVSQKQIHFSFPKDPLAIMSCWHLIEFFNVF